MIKVAWITSGRLRPHGLRIKTILYRITLRDNTDTLNLLFGLNRHGFNSSNLFVFGKIWITNSSESWRLIQGAETARGISFNYLKFKGFISTYLCHPIFRFVWAFWTGRWRGRFPWPYWTRSALGIMASPDGPTPTENPYTVKYANREFNKTSLINFRWIP